MTGPEGNPVEGSKYAALRRRFYRRPRKGQFLFEPTFFFSWRDEAFVFLFFCKLDLGRKAFIFVFSTPRERGSNLWPMSMSVKVTLSRTVVVTEPTVVSVI